MENYVGKRLDGRYEIHDVIGVGGMAIVYKAYDNIDDRIVAVKVLKDEYLANEEFRRRFKNESKAIAVLSHPNIVKVFDVSFGDRLQYIVMEHIEGITLKEYIEERGVIDWKEALFFMNQILKALQHAHDKGIVHRDIKPQNIMLLENGTIKVADFGIARFSHGETKTMTEKAIGSVHYISPEQAKGEPTDEKADIYSIVILLYEMLTGKLPFEAESAVSVALMQVNKNAIPPRKLNPNIPVGFEQITMKAIQKNPRDRYCSAAEFLMDIEDLRRNPDIKFDYRTVFVDDDPTRFVDDVGATQVIKTVPPSTDARMKLEEVNSEEFDAVQDVTSKKRVNTKIIGVVAGIAFAVIIFLFVLIAMVLKDGVPTLFTSRKVEVDNFIGMNYLEEIKDNEEFDEKFKFEPHYEPFSDGKEGCVFKQDPEAGTKVPKGRVIILYIATSAEGQIVPDFGDDVNYQEAVNTLESMGFNVILEPVNDDKYPIGKVIKTKPAAGSSIFAGSDVTVYYSANEDAGELFKMPDVTGKTAKEAEKLLKKHGLTVSKKEVVDSTIEKDRVVMQSPAEGSPVREGDKVILTLSSGEVTFKKTIDLPQKVGTVNVKMYVDDKVVANDNIDTAAITKYTIETKGDSPASTIKIYIKDKLYYECNVNFTKEPVVATNERYYTVSFYVDVVGLDRDAALTKLNEAGFTNVSVIELPSDKPAGTVIVQSPAASESNVDKTTPITLYVAQANSDETQQNTENPGQ